MKNILGLDLGSGSIGWAVIQEEEENKPSILGIGSRIIPLSTDDATQFTQGQSITKNADRTKARTQRKMLNRYQMRRSMLTAFLHEYGMTPDERLIKLPPVELWGIRAKAVTEEISLPELGRVLYHLNQKRGYKSAKGDYDECDKEKSKYLSDLTNREKELREKDMTIGQKFYAELKADPSYRCKDRVYPRESYIEEFDRIMECQRQYHNILTDDRIAYLRNHIIYYQRPLKSCKHLVGKCTLAQMVYQLPDGSLKSRGIKVAPRTSPLFQVCKIWQTLNNLEIKHGKEKLILSKEQRQTLFEHLNTNEKLTPAYFYKITGISKKEGWSVEQTLGRGLQGNTTYTALKNALDGYAEAGKLLRFELHIRTVEIADCETGEILQQPVIDTDFEQEPLYQLWHTLYSINDREVLDRVLIRKFGITDDAIRGKLKNIDFVKAGYGNLSSLAMRRILPYLMQGYVYSEACFRAGYNHSQSLTKEENQSRELAKALSQIPRGDLRQPVIEKILNQMVNLVNALIDKYGAFDEIRVELARELKQSREERENTKERMNENQKRNDKIRERILNEYKLYPTYSRIQKYKLWEESGNLCMYCGQPVDCNAFLKGTEVEREHIIPQSLFFDDSFANKVCACRNCNQEKNNRTAYDYMSSKPENEFKKYLDRIDSLWKEKKISNEKHKYLLMKECEIPQDFINRQLRESQYIARKAMEILKTICYNVYATSGSVTAYLRHLWGWDTVLHDLNLNRYREGGLTENINNRECIKGWDKRLDHRHHAIDALTIACTKQGYIQRINTLAAHKDEKGYSSLDRYIQEQPHFTHQEVYSAAEKILISFKAGKRAASSGKRYIHKGGKRILVQQNIIIPRGALSKESVYGKIARYHKDKKGNISFQDEYVIKYPVSGITKKNVGDIVDKNIRNILSQRLDEYKDNEKKAFSTPIYTSDGKPIQTVRCFTGLKAVAPVKYNEKGEAIGFVKPNNNHHIAIYTDKEGMLQEHVVTFWHAVERKKYRLPVIIEHPDEVWDSVNDNMDEKFLKQLPDPTWKFLLSMQQNEMFVLGLPDDIYTDSLENRDYALLSNYLYRVQKLATKNYCFRLHTETSVDDKYEGTKNELLSKAMGKLKIIQSMDAFKKINPHKVRINYVGEIIPL
ncbi:MAG: type II CRISPR RNA-guided endonuclease Cas9 [Porphyromonadaceae bacterium]|nr:type II CRISPR RNA-guided endonuclease Cas9 [Porphyromonadaceae bacterium]